MHLASRMQAGRLLAAKLPPNYQTEKWAILALNSGGVSVGAELSRKLGCILTLLERDNQGPKNRYPIYPEETRLHQIDTKAGSTSKFNSKLLKGHNIIVVADGLALGEEVDSAHNFLKPIGIAKLVFAIPLASLQAVSRMHSLADELYCLSVIDNYSETKHYYDEQDVPSYLGAI